MPRRANNLQVPLKSVPVIVPSSRFIWSIRIAQTELHPPQDNILQINAKPKAVLPHPQTVEESHLDDWTGNDLPAQFTFLEVAVPDVFSLYWSLLEFHPREFSFDFPFRLQTTRKPDGEILHLSSRESDSRVSSWNPSSSTLLYQYRLLALEDDSEKLNVYGYETRSFMPSWYLMPKPVEWSISAVAPMSMRAVMAKRINTWCPSSHSQ